MFFFNVTAVHIEEQLSISLLVQLGKRWVTSENSSGSLLKLRYVNHKNGSSSQDSEFDLLCLSNTRLVALADRFSKLEKLRPFPQFLRKKLCKAIDSIDIRQTNNLSPDIPLLKELMLIRVA
ncbi:hypothetical protein RYX36_016763 [Vicia faba]